MAAILSFEAVGYRDTMGRFARRTDELEIGLRDTVRAETRALWRAVQFYAPVKSGKFRAGLRYRTDAHGDGRVTGTIYASGPHAFLLPMLAGGTKPHPIVAKPGKTLRFFWDHGPRGPGIYYYKSVMHPGTMPDPFISIALGSREPHLEYNLLKLARRVAYLGV